MSAMSATGLPIAPPPIAANALAMIGNTPMVEFANLDTGPCRLFVKLENQNPGGSIKDRIGLSMIEAAERDGLLGPGGTLIEATAGNTGLGLALVAAQKGYRLIIVMPDKMSQEKVFHLRSLGAEVRTTRSDVGKGHPEYYQDYAERLAQENGWYFINQFANPANPAAHEHGTGPEIWEQMAHDVDAVVCGVGSGGTITGLGRYFARVSPATEMILADPEGSVLADYVETGELSDHVGSWMVEGIGEDFIPPVSDLSLATAAITVADAEAFETAREVLRREGIIAGSSSGTLIAAALSWCRAQSEPKRVVTFVCDSGNKYLSKMYNDYWMIDQGFIRRETEGDLRDLIARRYAERATVVAKPDETLLQAYSRMKLYDVSQLPVIEDDRIAGIIDESDMLLHVVGDESRFQDPVRTAMTEKVQTVPATAPVEELLPIFEAGRVAVVVDGDGAFQGLITQIDLLNYLRRKLR